MPHKIVIFNIPCLVQLKLALKIISLQLIDLLIQQMLQGLEFSGYLPRNTDSD